jgi:dimethylaniline monooxygenase (N-oxide forming)
MFDCSHIALCTGLHVEPNIPHIPGIENLKGEAFHSSQYKARSQLTGKTVLILGCGETAMGNVSSCVLGSR